MKLQRLLGSIFAGVAMFCWQAGSLAAGVTIIAHGFGDNVEGWVSQMSRSISERAGFGDLPNYKILVTGEVGNPVLNVTSGGRVSGPSSKQSRAGEIIVLLDWSDLAGRVSGTAKFAGTSAVARAVAEKLLDSSFIPEIGGALAELPIHLIGHSRGGSLVCEIARCLGESAVWVDHLTTLDPHPLNIVTLVTDAQPKVFENVIFADNYWREDGLDSPLGDINDFFGEGVDPDGQFVNGAKDRKLNDNDLNGYGYNKEHLDVMLWYFGTIDLKTPTTNVEKEVKITEEMRQKWWNASEERGSKTGYYFSRISGGTMNGGTRANAAAGLRVAKARRENLSLLLTSAGLWDNIEIVDFPAHLTLTQGDRLEVHAYYEYQNPDAVIEFGIDSDANPFNGTSGSLARINASARSGGYLQEFLDTSSAPSGTYYSYAKISSKLHARYYYSQGRLTLNPGTTTTPGPTVSVTFPAHGSTFGSELIKFSGTATGNPTKVTWVNETTGRDGDANGTSTWDASIDLGRGNNRITVTAKDANGRSGTASVVVILDISNDQLTPAIVEQTWVSSAAPKRIFNGSVYVGFDPTNPEGGNERGLLKFQQLSIPEGSTINSATLRLRLAVSNPVNAADILVSCFRITDSWTQDTVNWNNQPGHSATEVASARIANAKQDYSFDVTSIVKSWAEGNLRDYGFKLISSVEDSGSLNDRSFVSPGLVINYRRDVPLPVVSITSPSSDAVFSATASPLNLAGNASDNVRVVSVTWANRANGQTGTANGTTSWNATVPLIRGTNEITVSAHDPAGNSGERMISVIHRIVDKPPSIPTNLIAASVSSSQIYLTWNASKDFGDSGLAGYRVYRDGTQLGETSLLSYSDSGLVPERNYCYTVVAYDNVPNASPASSPACASTLELRQPTLQIAHSRSQLTISWPSSARDYVLEYTDALPSTSWLPVAQTPVVEGDQNKIIVQATAGGRFYRLRQGSSPKISTNKYEIFVADENAFSGDGGGIIKVDPVTGSQSKVFSGPDFHDPEGIAIDANGDFLIADLNAKIFRLKPNTSTLTVVSSGGSLIAPRAVAVTANGDILVADTGAKSVIRINPSNGNQTKVSSGGSLAFPSDLKLDAQGKILVVDSNAFDGNGGIIKIDPVTGAQSTVSSSGKFKDPAGIAIAANGDIYVADVTALGGAVFKVDSTTGGQTVVTSGGNFKQIARIAFAPDGNLFVTDYDLPGGTTKGGVIRVNPITGDQTIVTAGQNFRSPVGIVIVAKP